MGRHTPARRPKRGFIRPHRPRHRHSVLSGNAAPSLFTLTGGKQVQANFIIGSSQTWSVSGKLDRELKPNEGRFWLGLVLPEQPGLAIAAAQTEPSGAFTFEGIPAGNYDLLVSGPSRGYGGGGGILEPVAQYARMHVIVSGQNITGLVVSPAPGDPRRSC